MARKEQVTCDVCGALKQVSNHWFVVGRRKDCIYVVTSGEIRLRYQSADTSIPDEVFDLCGEACVLKKVSELISKQWHQRNERTWQDSKTNSTWSA